MSKDHFFPGSGASLLVALVAVREYAGKGETSRSALQFSSLVLLPRLISSQYLVCALASYPSSSVFSPPLALSVSIARPVSLGAVTCPIGMSIMF